MAFVLLLSTFAVFTVDAVTVSVDASGQLKIKGLTGTTSGMGLQRGKV